MKTYPEIMEIIKNWETLISVKVSRDDKIYVVNNFHRFRLGTSDYEIFLFPQRIWFQPNGGSRIVYGLTVIDSKSLENYHFLFPPDIRWIVRSYPITVFDLLENDLIEDEIKEDLLYRLDLF